MYKETKVPEDFVNDPQKRNFSTNRLGMIATVKSFNPKTERDERELEINELLDKIQEKQELFFELLSHIHTKLLVLEKKYEIGQKETPIQSIQKIILTKTSINQLIFDTINVAQKSSRVQIRLGLDIDIEISADGIMLLQVFSGVLQNFIKFGNSEKIKIESFVVREHNQVIIRFGDVTKEDTHREKQNSSKNIFSKHMIQQRDFHVYKEVIELHGGQISIKDESNEKFVTIRLPIKNKRHF